MATVGVSGRQVDYERAAYEGDTEVVVFDQYHPLGVLADAPLTDNAIVRGNGGARGVQTSGVLVDDSNNVTGAGTFNGITVEAHATRHTDGDDDIQDATSTLKGIASFYVQDFFVTGGQVRHGLLDSDSSHRLILSGFVNDLTADRALSLATGDASRVLTLTGNPTLGDWFDQSVKIAASPTFGGLTVNSQAHIDGSADEVQVLIDAHSTQTTDILQVYNSTPALIAQLNDNGKLTVLQLGAGQITSDNTITNAVAGGITHNGVNLAVLKGLLFDVSMGGTHTGSFAVTGCDFTAGGLSVVAAGRTGVWKGALFQAGCAKAQTSATASIQCIGGQFRAHAGAAKHTDGHFALISGYFQKPPTPPGAPTSHFELGIHSDGDVQVATGQALRLSGSLASLGDDYITCDATTMKFYMADVEELAIDTGQVTVANTLLCTGDQVFSGAGTGLPYAEIYAVAAADTITIAAAGQGNKVQVTSFDTNGQSNNMTSDHTNDHITVVQAGMYLCTVSLHIESAGGGGADTFGFSLYKNNGTAEFVNVHGHRRLAGGGGDVGSVSLSGIIDLAAADTIELWCWNEDSDDDLVVQDVTMSLVQIGGT